MIERDKQRTDQEKKHAAEKERRKHSKDKDKNLPQKPNARSDTDPSSVKDKAYVKRVEEKTEKH